MRYLSIFLICFIFSFLSNAEENVKIINLHGADNKTLNEEKINTEVNEEKINTEANEEKINTEVNINQIKTEESLFMDSTEDIIDENNTLNEGNENIEIEESNKEEDLQESIITIPDLWHNSNKIDIEFLFENIEANNSSVLTSLLVKNLVEYLNAPNTFAQGEFDNLRVKTLLKLGKREEAINLLKSINTYDNYKNYYDLLKLDYFFSTNNLSEACSFKESLKDGLNTTSNYILKINIFCAFIQNKIEEADFLNSLLIDSNDKDEYFQKIYFNLKNNLNDIIDFSSLSFDHNSFPLYSAMLRIGNISLNEKFLEYDPINLSMPIILSPSTNILLRLKSAHKSYELELLNGESLSALYQTVDFNYEQLNNSQQSLNNFKNKSELGMALLYQKANIQLLPITRLESLKEFWIYAKKNDLEILAYDISKGLIDSLEPSAELSEYALFISRAHIHNKNFDLAEKWILFADKYLLDDDNSMISEKQTIKLLYDLKTSKDDETFVNNLINNEVINLNDDNLVLDETLTTIISSVIENYLDMNLKETKKIFDDRIMPSKYILEKIINSSYSNNIGELVLSMNISMNGKAWKDVHPYHLKILIESLRRTELRNIFKELVIEILEDTKII